MPTLANRWVVLAVLCLARVTLGLQFQSIPPLAPFLIADMGLSYTEVGTLIGLFLLPGAFLALPGGLLGARFGDKTVVVVALALLAVGALTFARSHALALASSGRVLSGAGGALLSLQLTKMTTDWFAGREISTAMGVLLSMWPLGMASALATLGTVAAATSWQTAIYTTAGYAALALGLIAILYRDPETSIRAVGAGRAPLWAISNRELALALVSGAAWMVLNAGFVLFVSFTPTLLGTRGYSPAAAGFLVSWASLISIGSLPLGGYLIDRTHRLDLLVVAGSIATAAACVAVPLGGPAGLWIALFGIVFAPTVGIIALPATVLRPESRGTGFGVFYTVYYVGMAATPPLAGYLLDVTGRAGAPLWLGAVLWLMVIPALGGFRALERRWALSGPRPG